MMLWKEVGEGFFGRNLEKDSSEGIWRTMLWKEASKVPSCVAKNLIQKEASKGDFLEGHVSLRINNTCPLVTILEVRAL